MKEITPESLSKAQHNIAIMLEQAFNARNLPLIAKNVKRLIDMNCHLFIKLNQRETEIRILKAENELERHDNNRLRDENFKLVCGESGKKHYEEASRLLSEFYSELGMKP